MYQMFDSLACRGVFLGRVTTDSKTFHVISEEVVSLKLMYHNRIEKQTHSVASQNYIQSKPSTPIPFGGTVFLWV